jgi:hypothetical protein
MSYLNSASLSALLKKEMGFSNPASFFYSRTEATVSKEAKEKVKKSFE